MAINNITQNISSIPQAGRRGVDVQTIFVNKQEAFQDALTNTFVEQINTLRNQLNTFVGEVNSTASQVNIDATSASSSASLSSTKANEASTSASQALTSRNQAETFKNNANDSALKAGKWADNPYNVEVETGKYSARHYAETAQNIVSNTVDKTTNQSIDGVKTFVKSPIVPTPINNNETANKSYVDTKVPKVTSTDNAIVRFDGTAGAVQNSGVVIDDNGNIGIGVTPSQLEIGKGIELGLSGGIYGDGINYSWNTQVTQNAYPIMGGQHRYRYYNAAGAYIIDGSTHRWKTAPVGTSGDIINWTNAMTLDVSGNLLLQSGTGALGYGVGAGGTVTQLTSKSTPVTLNKPTGLITLNNSALGSGQYVDFPFYNNLIAPTDIVYVSVAGGINFVNSYEVRSYTSSSGWCFIILKNVHTASLSEAIQIRFMILKGANS